MVFLDIIRACGFFNPPGLKLGKLFYIFDGLTTKTDDFFIIIVQPSG